MTDAERIAMYREWRELAEKFPNVYRMTHLKAFDTKRPHTLQLCGFEFMLCQLVGGNEWRIIAVSPPWIPRDVVGENEGDAAAVIPLRPKRG